MLLNQVGKLTLLAALGGAWLFSQTNTSRLEGTVQDQSGAVIAEARVAAINDNAQIRAEVMTSADGHYIFPSIQPGAYVLMVEASGFRRATVTGVTLTVAENVTQNITLELGAVTETVDVKANALSVQVSEAQVSQAVTMKDIDTLPQLARRSNTSFSGTPSERSDTWARAE